MAKARRYTHSGSRGSDLSEAHGTACEKRQREGGAKHESWEKKVGVWVEGGGRDLS